MIHSIFRDLRRISHNLQGWCQEFARTDNSPLHSALTSSPPSEPPSTTSWRVAAAHVLRAAAHGACAFGVDLVPTTVHVYLGPVDDDPEGATAPGRRRRRKGAVLHYSNNAGDDPGAAPRRATPTGGPDAASASAAAATDRRWLLGPWTPTRRTPSISRRPRSVGCA